MKTSTIVILGAAAVAAYFLVNKKDEQSSASDSAGAPANNPQLIVSNDLNAVAAKERVLANPTMERALSLVVSKSTSSVEEIQAQRAASRAGKAYSGVSNGVVYKVSAPQKPSAGQAAALRAAGYGQYA